MRIRNKRQMYSLLKAGAFGNSFRIWDTAEELIESGFNGLLGVRCSDVPGAPYFHHLTVPEAIYKANEMELAGHVPVVYEASPDEHITIQGEYGSFQEYYALTYSFQKTHMRKALKESPLYAYGRKAEYIMRHYLSESSYADLEAIFEVFTETPLVVEFTAFDIMIGNLFGRNSTVWEVRNY